MFKLLIVDDEEIERRAITHIVENVDIRINEILQASNGQEAVAVAAASEPDIIIMDITMPGLNGIKAADIIKKFLPDTRIIFLTAFDEFDYAKEAIKLGADDFVVKPAAPETIESTILNSIKRIQHKNEQQQKTELAREKLQGAAKYLEECLVEALIEGESNEKKIKKYLSFTNINFEYSFGSVISMQFDQPSIYLESSLEIKKQMIFEKLISHIGDIIPKSIFYINGFYLYIFIYDTLYENIISSKESLEKSWEKIEKKIYEDNAAILSLGTGDVCKAVSTIWNSFMQAKERLINHDDSAEEKSSIDIIGELAQSIVNNEKYIERAHINKVHNILWSENESIEKYRIKLLEFSVMLKQMIINKVRRPIMIDDSLYLSISRIISPEQGLEYLTLYSEKLRKIASLGDRDKNAIIIDELAMYIEEHITENITLDYLSEISKLSTYYICKLFKKYFDMNLVDYITFIRIENAKKYLLDPYLSVKEVCHKSGYTDPNYFARVFKKATGTSPTNYRKLNLNDKN